MLTRKPSHGPPSARVKLTTIKTRDPTLASEQMSAIVGTRVRVDGLGRPADFGAWVQVAAFGGVTLAKHENTSWTHAHEGRVHFSLTLVLDGDLNYRGGSRVRDHEPATGMAVGRPFETTRASARRCAALSLAFPVRGILERAERLTGESHGGSLISSAVDHVDTTTPMGKALSRCMKTAMAEIGGLESLGMGALAAGGYADMLLNLAVPCLFPAVADRMAVAPADSGPAVIRRARDFIRERAARPIDFSHLAAELGVSMRALQENFQRYFGLSPRAYLLECRLDLARQSLLTPGGAMTVTDVGFDCGFGDLSHFAAKYREKFGESPSETLRAAR